MELIKQAQQTPSAPGNSMIHQAAASKGQMRICHCSDEEVKSALRYVMILLGLTGKDVPDEVEKQVLMEFIRDEYGNRFSPEEIRLAFRWAMSGKTDVNKSFYGKRFSVAYLSNFMEAYDEKKKEMLALHKEEKPALMLEQDTRTVEQRLKDRYEIFEKYVIENKRIPPMLDVIACFNYLELKGLLALTKENIERHQLQAEIELEAEYEKAKVSRDKFTVLELMRNMKDLKEIDYRTKRKFVEEYLLSKVASPLPPQS